MEPAEKFLRKQTVPVSFIDVALCLAMVMMIVVGMMLPWLHDPGEKDDLIAPPPGNIMVEIHWDKEKNVDIDLWVLGPVEGDVPVGYTGMHGAQFDLLRDDRGRYFELKGSENYEISVGRGIYQGTYVVNLVYYGPLDSNEPIDVEVAVTIIKQGERGELVLKRTVTITRFQELNVFVFDVNEKQQLVASSVYVDDTIRIGSTNRAGGPNNND